MDKEIEDILIKFADESVQLMRKNLISAMISRAELYGGSAMTISRNLAQSITFKVSSSEVSAKISIEMPRHADFINEGVRGNKGTKPGAENSPYQFRDKMPPVRVFTGMNSWISQHGIDVGQSKGKSMSDKIKRQKSLAFLIARSIKDRGIPGYHFIDFIYEKATIDSLNELLVDKLKDNVKIEILKTVI